MHIDALDKQLTELLADNGWQSADVLAKRLSTSASTVRRRTKQLIDSGTIRIVALSDPDKIGLPVTAVVVFDVAGEKLDAVMQELNHRPEVRWTANTIGRFNVVALLRLPTIEDLFHIVQRELTKIQGVRNTETLICVRTTKGGRYLPL